MKLLSPSWSGTEWCAGEILFEGFLQLAGRRTNSFQLFLFGIITVSINLPQTAAAELWKCTPKSGTTPPIYTETPSFGDDVDCIQLSSLRFSKPGQGGAPVAKKGTKKVIKKTPAVKGKKRAKDKK